MKNRRYDVKTGNVEKNLLLIISDMESMQSLKEVKSSACITRSSNPFCFWFLSEGNERRQEDDW